MPMRSALEMDSKGTRWLGVAVCFTDRESRLADVFMCILLIKRSRNERATSPTWPLGIHVCWTGQARKPLAALLCRLRKLAGAYTVMASVRHCTSNHDKEVDATLANHGEVQTSPPRDGNDGSYYTCILRLQIHSYCTCTHLATIIQPWVQMTRALRRDKRSIPCRAFCVSYHHHLLTRAYSIGVFGVSDSPAKPAKPISLTSQPRTGRRESGGDWMSGRTCNYGNISPEQLEDKVTGSDAHGTDEGRYRVHAHSKTYDQSHDEREEADAVDACGDNEAGATQHLLAHDTLALNANPAAADTARDIDGEQPPPPLPTTGRREKDQPHPVTWSSLPQKSQLAILTLARLSEPLTQTSLQAYMFYQLKSFHPPDEEPPSDATVAQQAGLLAAAFTGAQFLTAMMWGRLADSEKFGRKSVILIGLLGTMVGSLGFGFSGSFGVAVFWRVVGGMLNGNIGVMRTMISEMVKDKKYLSRAFLLLPMCFNIGVIVGPLLGGLLADPAGSYLDVFGEVGWLRRWPYALPNVVMAVFLAGSAAGVVFGLDETLEGLRDRPDRGRRLAKWVVRVIFKRGRQQEYAALPEDERVSEDVELGSASATNKKPTATPKRRLPFRRLWTPNLLLTLLAHGLLAMHVGTFSNLWFVYLSTPRYSPNHDSNSTPLHLPENYHPHPPLTFTGGLALPPPSIGTALAILGVIGITMQLLVYPRVSFKLGTQTSFRLALCLFPVSYTLTPYLSLIPSTTASPHPASGPYIWTSISTLLAIQVLARTFALPSTAILVNNACPHPSVLGTVHGIAQSASSATRTLGPVVAGWLYGVGLRRGVVGLAWWCMAFVAILGAVAGRWVREGSGQEVWLEGEREEDSRVETKG
ncbi:MFS general substrate transporter [Teratosphaeria nubilosa]|uniref:MFS general substrate transporter n=1 Tax=Teratosphaeria nubilosa TaxID=161662 RepID=A0A6G1LJ20_9PEZI|nr:MFS general substrate transporter [Teratosphaeria nubilosa]